MWRHRSWHTGCTHRGCWGRSLHTGHQTRRSRQSQFRVTFFKKIQFELELYVFQGGRAAVPFPPAPGWLRAVWGVVQGGLRHRILLGVRRTSKHLFGKPVYFSSSSRDYDSESHFELAQRLHPEYFSLLPDKDDVFPHHFHDMMGGDYVRLWGIRQLTYSRKMSV